MKLTESGKQKANKQLVSVGLPPSLSFGHFLSLQLPCWHRTALFLYLVFFVVLVPDRRRWHISALPLFASCGIVLLTNPEFPPSTSVFFSLIRNTGDRRRHAVRKIYTYDNVWTVSTRRQRVAVGFFFLSAHSLFYASDLPSCFLSLSEDIGRVWRALVKFTHSLWGFRQLTF